MLACAFHKCELIRGNKTNISIPLQHIWLQECCTSIAEHYNVAVILQVALQYSCNIVETLPCNIAMATFVQCFRNIAHTLPCNIAMSTFVQYFRNIAHTLPCNIAMSTFVQYFRNIAHTLPCNIAMATFVQRLSNESEINPEFRVAIPNCRHAEFSLRFHRLTPSEYMRTWTIS